MKWSKEEEDCLMEQVNLYNDDLNFAFDVASYFTKHSLSACKSKYNRLKNNYILIANTKVIHKKMTIFERVKNFYSKRIKSLFKRNYAF